MLVNGRTAMEGLSGRARGWFDPAETPFGSAAADWLHTCIRHARIGSAMLTNESEPIEDASLRSLASPKPEACISSGTSLSGA